MGSRQFNRALEQLSALFAWRPCRRRRRVFRRSGRGRLIERVDRCWIDQTTARRRSLLFLNFVQNDIDLRQRPLETRDQFSFQQFGKIDIEHGRTLPGMRPPGDHLSIVKLTRLTRDALEVDFAVAVENDELAPAFRVIFEHCGEASHGCRHGGCLDSYLSSPLWCGHQNRAVVQIVRPSLLSKAEKRIRAEPSESLIGKRELGPRIVARPDGGSFVDVVVQCCGSGRGLGWKEPHVVNDSSHAGRFLRRADGNSRDSDCENETGEPNESSFHDVMMSKIRSITGRPEDLLVARR